MGAFFQGLMLGAGLIIAIGSQNAYVLRQGLKREHVFLICLVCALSDALLISLGVSGTGTLVASSEMLLNFVRVGGALFLLFYGVRAARAAMKSEYLDASLGAVAPTPLKVALLTTLAFTYLNPHVYLDTLVLVGSIAGQFEWRERIQFGAGAIVASFAWFFALGYGARWLAPLFKTALAWKILDSLIAVIMFGLAIGLVSPLFA